jgi:hypothetical protein
MINDKKHTATITDCQIVAATWGIGVCKAEISAAATWLRKGYEVAFIYANVQPERLIAAPYGGRANAAKLQKQATTDGNAFDNSTKRSLAAQQQEEAEWAADQRRLRAARQAS